MTPVQACEVIVFANWRMPVIDHIYVITFYCTCGKTHIKVALLATLLNGGRTSAYLYIMCLAEYRVLSRTFVVSGVLLTMVVVGMMLGFTTSLLPALEDPNSDIKSDVAMSSWIAATFSLAWIPSFFTSAYCMDRFGRKIAFILDIIPAFIGLILMYYATNVPTILVARALGGITAGSTSMLGAIVIGEYSDPVHRGMFLNLKTAALYMGSAMAHILGNNYHWRTLALISLGPCIASFAVILTWPESPFYLATKDEFEKSEKAFYWLRGRTEQTTKELKDIFKAQQMRTKSAEINLSKKVIIFFRKFGRRDFVKPVVIYFFAATLLETSGRHIFPAYAVQIISEISGKTVSIYYTLFLDMLITVSAFFSSILIRMFKRRTLLFTTGIAAFAVLMSVCSYLFLASISVISNVSWIPISLFGLYLAIVNFACAPIPLALVGEIFPLEHKAAGTTIAGLSIAFNTIITLKTMPIMMATVKVYGTFLILGLLMAVSLLILYFMLPETKDRTLQEIENYFNYGDFKADDQLKDDNETESRMMTNEKV